MVWAYKLKKLTLLHWVGFCLLALNVWGGSLLFFSEPVLEDREVDYPSLELFSTGSSSELSAKHTGGHVANTTDSESVISESLHDPDFERPKVISSMHSEGVGPIVSQDSGIAQPEDLYTSKPDEDKQKKISKGASSRVCYEIGPLVLNEDKARLQSGLEMRGMFTSMKYHQTNENLGYWVFIPPIRSRALGRLKVEELKFKGFKNAVLLSRAEPVNAVSLGVFENQKDAHELLLKAQSLGFDVKMDVRSQGVANAWLAVEVDQQRNLDEESWVSLLKDYTGLKRQLVNCP